MGGVGVRGNGCVGGGGEGCWLVSETFALYGDLADGVVEQLRLVPCHPSTVHEQRAAVGAPEGGEHVVPQKNKNKR